MFIRFIPLFGIASIIYYNSPRIISIAIIYPYNTSTMDKHNSRINNNKLKANKLSMEHTWKYNKISQSIWCNGGVLFLIITIQCNLCKCKWLHIKLWQISILLSFIVTKTSFLNVHATSKEEIAFECHCNSK